MSAVSHEGLYQYYRNGFLMHPVRSSFIAAVGHDGTNSILAVLLSKGQCYYYKDVPRDLFERFLRAKSKGNFFNAHIEPHFRHVDVHHIHLEDIKPTAADINVTVNQQPPARPFAEISTGRNKISFLHELIALFSHTLGVAIISCFTGLPILFIYLFVRYMPLTGIGRADAKIIAAVLVSLAISMIAGVKYKRQSCKDHKDELKRVVAEKERELYGREVSVEQAELKLKKRERKQEAIEADFNKMFCEEQQNNPWLARQFADFMYLIDEESARYLRNKSRPAKSAAETVQRIAREKRDLQARCKMLEYQLSFLENTYTWLPAFEEIPKSEAVRYVFGANRDYDVLRDWLSPAEYSTLSQTEKNQLALDRYKAKKKTEWEVGRDYERYIGYVFENEGYSVDYVGALYGREDRGIDILAHKGNETVVVQCKRYSEIKSHFVHENTVAQLFGVAAVYRMENPDKVVIPVIYTSSALAKEAKRFAEYLNIKVVERFPIKVYPMIKCNVSKNGEKIYHLPFDQQYDKVKTATKKGSFYAEKVKDAEDQGFRHAHRWNPNSEK